MLLCAVRWARVAVVCKESNFLLRLIKLSSMHHAEGCERIHKAIGFHSRRAHLFRAQNLNKTFKREAILHSDTFRLPLLFNLFSSSSSCFVSIACRPHNSRTGRVFQKLAHCSLKALFWLPSCSREGSFYCLFVITWWRYMSTERLRWFFFLFFFFFLLLPSFFSSSSCSSSSSSTSSSSS